MASCDQILDSRAPRQLVAVGLRAVLETRGFSVERTADLAGCSATHLRDVIAGRACMGLDRLERVAVTLRIDAADLLTSSHPPPPVGFAQPRLRCVVASHVRAQALRHDVSLELLAVLLGWSRGTIYSVVHLEVSLCIDRIASLAVMAAVPPDVVLRPLPHPSKFQDPAERDGALSLR